MSSCVSAWLSCSCPDRWLWHITTYRGNCAVSIYTSIDSSQGVRRRTPSGGRKPPPTSCSQFSTRIKACCGLQPACSCTCRVIAGSVEQQHRLHQAFKSCRHLLQFLDHKLDIRILVDGPLYQFLGISIGEGHAGADGASSTAPEAKFQIDTLSLNSIWFSHRYAIYL